MLVVWFGCTREFESIEPGDFLDADTDRRPCVPFYGSCDCSAKCRLIVETDLPDTACELGCLGDIDWTCALQEGKCVVVAAD
jgi:hypothetical protein